MMVITYILLLITLSTTTLASDFVKINALHETTNWDLLEDFYLYFNAIRYFHDASSIRFNRTLTEYARLKALIFAWYDGEVPPENGNIKFGENVHWYPSSEVDVNASDVIEDWYFNEEPYWDYENPQVSEATKDFSQIAWNSTTRFGCGQAVSKGAKGGTYTVCFFDPPGNVAGEERVNVFKSPYSEEDEEETTTSTSGSTTEGTTASGSTTVETTTSGVTTTPSSESFIRSFVTADRKKTAEKLLRYQNPDFLL